jgi:suppressor of G2 allele of SKP1
MTLNNALHLISSTDKESLNLLTPWLNKADVELKEGGVVDYNVTNVGQLKIIYNWIQTGTDITIDVTSNHNLNAYDIKLEKKLISFIDKKEGTVKYEIKLTNGILPEKSSFKITSAMKCKLELKKEVENFNWVNLEVNPSDDSLNNPKDKVIHGYYPSSSKVKKDWSQLDKEFDEQEKEDALKDGNEGMWRLFRDIYAKGNEETRRAMIKSFQTSGGTVLSTNWNEVKDKDYEGKDRPEAPSGQEWATPPKK